MKSRLEMRSNCSYWVFYLSQICSSILVLRRVNPRGLNSTRVGYRSISWLGFVYFPAWPSLLSFDTEGKTESICDGLRVS
jgi:hypothetical protein